MILQALYECYQRAASDPERQVAPEGFEWKEIPFVVVLNQEGEFRALEDTREGVGRNRHAKSFLVPQAAKRTGKSINANLLWDNVEYTLGANPRNRHDVVERHEEFKRRLLDDLGHVVNLPAVKAIKVFVENNPVQQIEKHKEYAESWEETLEKNLNIIFRIEGSEDTCVCDTLRPFISDKSKGGGVVGLCLMTGEESQISRLHAPIKGVRGTNTSGGALVSFNLPAFESFNKTQNYNAPISEVAAFSYTTGLNMLLRRNSPNKMMVGDAH